MQRADHSELYASVLLTIVTVFLSALAIDIKLFILSDANVGYRHQIVMGAEALAVVLCLLAICVVARVYQSDFVTRVVIGGATFVPSIFLSFILDDVSRVYSYAVHYSAADIRMVAIESAAAVAGFVLLAIVVNHWRLALTRGQRL